VLFSNPLVSVTPAVLIVVVACAVNLLGDALNSRGGKQPGR